LVAVLAAALALGGCVEVEEDLVLAGDGSGTYALTVRWDADLWRRVTDVLGPAVMGRIEGRAFPLRPEQLRDGLAGLDGVTIQELEERPGTGGRRELVVRLAFRDVPALLRWELMARRTLRIERAEEGAGTEPAWRLTYHPIAQVPLLDRLGALLDAVERPPPAAEGETADRDPPPLERLGLDRDAAELVWRMVKGPLEAASLRFRVAVPSDLVTVRGRAVPAGTREAVATYDLTALRRPGTDRTLRFTWRARAFDRFPVVDHEGDRDPRSRKPDGTRR
jgi:hypothetical protein